ncbi:MAG: putative polymerase subfamily sigma factor [Ilumatobacteraceae bacterium]|nr:putative polymerase subfamily sigma factor [Ilumatobacteraceae bacterium]
MDRGEVSGVRVADASAPTVVGRTRVARTEVARLFDLHAASIHRYAARRVGIDVAADVVSDVFLIALDRYDTFVPERGGARGWLYGIANNVMRRHWRTEQRCLAALARHDAASLPFVDPLLAVDRRIDADAEVERVVRNVAALPPEDRDLLTMFAWERLSYADIAEAMGIPVGTVRSRLNRVRRQLGELRVEGVVHE